MNKSELVSRLWTQYPHLSLSDMDAIVNIILDEVTESLVQGNRVELRGFGSFFTKTRQERIGRNPRTGDAIAVPEKTVPLFKTGKNLHQRINHK